MPSFDDLNQVNNTPSGSVFGNDTTGTIKESFTQDVKTEDAGTAKEDADAPNQRSGGGKGTSEDFEVVDFRAGKDAFRAWRHGAKVANGKGFFCSPPASQNPLINADYQRFYVDSGNIATLTGGATTSGSAVVAVTSTAAISLYPGIAIRGAGIPENTWIKTINSATQITLTQNATATLSSQTYYAGEGIGIINTPMSDMTFLSASGEPADGRGDIIAVLKGPRTMGSNSTGIFDLWSVLVLLTGGSAVEAGAFNFPGALFFRSSAGFNVPRFFDGSIWRDSAHPRRASSSVAVSGTSVPVSTFIASIDSATQITMNNNATGSGSVSITFNINGTIIVRTGTVTSGSPIVAITAGNGGTNGLYVGIENNSNNSVEGFFYFDQESKKFRGHNGSAWVDLG